MSNTNSDGSSCKRRYLDTNKSREIDPEEIEIEKQKEYCNTVVADCDSCSYFLEQVSQLNKKEEVIRSPNVEEEELSTQNVEKENMLVKIRNSISFTNNNTIIVAGILVSLLSLVLLLCILAFNI